jgi:hypothetical protein
MIEIRSLRRPFSIAEDGTVETRSSEFGQAERSSHGGGALSAEVRPRLF